MEKIRYYRTWGITIYNGTRIYGVDYSDDNGKHWYTKASGYKSEEAAANYMHLIIKHHNDDMDQQREIAEGKHPFYTVPMYQWDVVWKLWSEQ